MIQESQTGEGPLMSANGFYGWMIHALRGNERRFVWKGARLEESIVAPTLFSNPWWILLSEKAIVAHLVIAALFCGAVNIGSLVFLLGPLVANASDPTVQSWWLWVVASAFGFSRAFFFPWGVGSFLWLGTLLGMKLRAKWQAVTVLRAFNTPGAVESLAATAFTDSERLFSFGLFLGLFMTGLAELLYILAALAFLVSWRCAPYAGFLLISVFAQVKLASIVKEQRVRVGICAAKRIQQENDFLENFSELKSMGLEEVFSTMLLESRSTEDRHLWFASLASNVSAIVPLVFQGVCLFAIITLDYLTSDGFNFARAMTVFGLLIAAFFPFSYVSIFLIRVGDLLPVLAKGPLLSDAGSRPSPFIPFQESREDLAETFSSTRTREPFIVLDGRFERDGRCIHCLEQGADCGLGTLLLHKECMKFFCRSCAGKLDPEDSLFVNDYGCHPYCFSTLRTRLNSRTCECQKPQTRWCMCGISLCDSCDCPLCLYRFSLVGKVELRGCGLVGLTGPVASGKSGFFSIICESGDYFVKEGSLSVLGSRALAMQQPVILPANLQENIVFGETFNHERYATVVAQACLGSLAHEVGDVILSSSSLSGGQQVRIGLARALYSSSDILLLDGCLRGLDHKTAKHVFENLLAESVSKLIILTLDDPEFLSCCASVVEVDRGHVTQRSSDLYEVAPAEAIALTTDESLSNVTPPSLRSLSAENVGKVTESRSSYWFYFGRVSFFVVVASCFVQSGFSIVFQVWISQLNVVSQDVALIVFGLIFGASVFFSFVYAVSFTYFHTRSSTDAFVSSWNAVKDSYFGLFETVPKDRLRSAFVDAIDIVDREVPFNLDLTLRYLCRFVCLIIAAAALLPVSLVALPLVLLFSFLLSRIVVRSLGPFKSLVVTNKQMAVQAVQALISVRNSLHLRHIQTKNRWFHLVFSKLDAFNASAAYSVGLSHWWTIYSLSFNNVLLLTALFAMVYQRNSLGGIPITLSIEFPAVGGLIIRYGIDAYTYCHSLLALLALRNLPRDPSLETDRVPPPEHWPSQGVVNVQKLCYKRILRDVSFRASPSSTLSISGPSGSGKSTLFNCLLGLLPASFEVYTIDDVSVLNLRGDLMRRQFGFLPQKSVVFSGLMRLNLDPLGQCSDEELRGILAELKLDKYSLDDEINLQSVSFGEGQLVNLGRLLARKSSLIFLDEAASALSSSAQAMIVTRILSLSATVLGVSHDLQVKQLFQRVLNLPSGTLVSNPATNLGALLGMELVDDE